MTHSKKHTSSLNEITKDHLSKTYIGLSLFFLINFHSNAQNKLSYSKDVLPILSDRCFACHGPDGGEFGEKWEGGLRLDTIEGALANLKMVKYRARTAKLISQGKKPSAPPTSSRHAIVPGKPENSLFIERIMTDDEDDVMPPVDSHLSLNHKEKQLLQRWIAEGAVYDTHWSFKTPVKPLLPKVKNKQWPRTAIDYFVLSKLEDKSITPSSESHKLTWLRRVTQDLAGLPPTLQEIKNFTVDSSPEAYQRVVDRLLHSDDYAERMTNIWLDNARYADSNGYQFDNQRTMWPWRNWVLKSFQENKKWSDFVTEQLAGDLLPSPTQEQLIATGFNRNHGYSIEGGIIDEEYRVDYAKDKANTVGTLFLGLTMECTSCHDHKYDPLTMTDYYSLFAFFNASTEKGAPGQKGRKQKSAAPFIKFKESKESAPVLAMVMKEKPRKSFILKQGIYDKPGAEVQPNTPAVLSSFTGYEKNRLGLAKWLVAPENPLFARVTVNRIWQQFFGTGIVKSSDNLGLQGALPTHQKLLDWLAVDFRENNWDLHQLIRNIVLSSTYRQSSNFRKNLEDPDNRLLARSSSFRLPAELIRDQALAVSGLLVKKVGGPSVFPYQPSGVWEDLNAPKKHAEVYKQGQGDDLYRKSLYTYWRRAVLHPAMAAFDAPSRDICAVSRESTNTPLQALITLHGPTYIESSRILAEKLIDSSDPISDLFLSVLTRAPTSKEKAILQDYFQTRLQHYQVNPESVTKLFGVGEMPANKELDSVRVAALADVCHTVLNLSEALTRN
ncbi:MAG: PSD1 and planctomycete cytochrome C domain-containing protein [Lentisphaerales bacterium]|nr:PSD1 and planctomycete cytochrome C domain-containing protein [Lentisphaerales bacterium]